MSQAIKGIARAHGKVQKQARPLTAEAWAAVKATAGIKRPFGGRGKGLESAQRASWRARVDLALLALDALRPVAAAPEGKVFGLAARQMNNRIKAVIKAAGFDGDAFSGHSGRVGLARMMSGAGAPTETTMRQGRWRTEAMVSRYIRKETVGAALRWMDGGVEASQ